MKHCFSDVDPADFQTALSEGVYAYVEAFRKESLKDGDKPFGFIRKVTKNSLLKRIRRAKLERPSMDVTADPDSHDVAASEINAKLTNDSILRRMRRDYRKFMILFYRKDFDLSEIALAMGKTLDAIYHLKERSEKQARKLAKEDELAPPPRNNHTKNNSNKKWIRVANGKGDRDL